MAALAPCAPWATEADLCEPCASLYDPERLPEMLEVASWVLYQLSGRRFPGECAATVRPCAPGPPGRGEPSGEHPANGGTSAWGGQWPAMGLGTGCGCSSPARCSCGGLAQIQLPGHVVTVDEVRVDGAVVDAATYRVDNWRWLVRVTDEDGNEGWPCCQRLDLPSTEPGTFEVTYTFGKAPPQAGVRAAAELACELVMACSPESMDKCRLPRNVTQVVRQGVTMAIDPRDFLKDGLTGLPLVDMFLTAVREGSKRRRANVVTPDLYPPTRRVGT